MHDSTAAPERVRARFEEHAHQFDDLYEDERWLVRTLRPGLFRRRRLAVESVKAYDAPRVLDVGCGSGRIGEFVLDAGAGHYVGVDFLTADLHGPFEVILAVGLFDYLPEPHRFTRRMFELCAPGGCVVGSFPAWSLLKGPVRKVRYEWIGDCPIFNYSRRELELMFGASGYDRVEIASPGRSGYLVRAYRT